jgi:hypothetical protein
MQEVCQKGGSFASVSEEYGELRLTVKRNREMEGITVSGIFLCFEPEAHPAHRAHPVATYTFKVGDLSAVCTGWAAIHAGPLGILARKYPAMGRPGRSISESAISQ